ncbi:acyl-CoA dehydrogenase family protein [Streptomyces sp. NPDC092903]|uniref:acyl-CoA dehydrogenase family protein n=1 Tax=Streptomyces sp. NPDC092903 TaxID=3366017 RepID=UPI0038058EC4
MNLTREQTTVRERVRQFAEAEIGPRVASMEAARSLERELPRLIARQGWIGVTIPREYGGLEAGHVAKSVIDEELSRVSGAMGAAAQASQLGTAMIIHLGSDEQKRTWLPQIAAGVCLPTIAVTEPGSGSHVLGVESTARRRGRGEYVLNGRKCFIGNSAIGDVHGIVVRTGKGTGAGSLSAFLVEADRPGLSLPRHRPGTGLHGFGFGELVLDNVRVPAENMIGDLGDGLTAALSSSTLYGKPNLTAVGLGIHQAIMDTTLLYAREHRRYGRPLEELPAVERRLGEIKSNLMSARILAYDAVSRLDRGEPCDFELTNAKLTNADWVLESARLAMEVHGAAGLDPAHHVERLERDARHIWAPAGTGDIHLKRLADLVTGRGRQHRQWSQIFAQPLTAPPHPAPTAPVPLLETLT